MTATIQKWGNSQGIRISKTMLDDLKWNNDEKVSMTVKDNSIIIEKIDDVSGKTIEELFEGYKGKYEKVDIDWGKAQGKEVW